MSSFGVRVPAYVVHQESTGGLMIRNASFGVGGGCVWLLRGVLLHTFFAGKVILVVTQPALHLTVFFVTAGS